MLNTSFTASPKLYALYPTPTLTPLETYQHNVKEMVSARRYAHIVRVMVLSEEIAKANHFNHRDRERTKLAALLHDAARDLSVEAIFQLCPPSCPMERDNPMSLHGQASAVLARQWGVKDTQVLDAIAGHVFGVSPHNHIGMAVYIADISEPARGVNEDIRDLAMHNLNEAYQQAVYAKICYLQSCGKAVHPQTLAAYQAMQQHDLAQHSLLSLTSLRDFESTPYPTNYPKQSPIVLTSQGSIS